MPVFRAYMLVFLCLNCLWLNSQSNKGFFKVYRMAGKDIPSGYVETDDGWIIAGNTTTRFLGFSDIPNLGFLMKIDLEGKIVWKQFISDTSNRDVFYNEYSDNSYIKENCIKKLRNGDLLITGITFTRGSFGVMALRFDPKNLVVKWRYRDNFQDNFTTLAADEDSSSGELYIFSERWYFNRHGYPCMHKLSADGRLIWKKHYSNLQIGNGGSISSFMFLNKDTPFFLVNYSNSNVDSCFLVKIKPNIGDIINKHVISLNHIPLEMYRCSRGYNILFNNLDGSSQNLQIFLDHDLNAIEQRYVPIIYVRINPKFGDGYDTYNPLDSISSFTNPDGKVYYKIKYPGIELSRYDNEFVLPYGNQSIHGGYFLLGYRNINVALGNDYTYEICRDDLNCTDITFMRSNDSGYFLKGPKQPNIDQVLIYPNPGSDRLSIRFDLNSAEHLSFELWDALGRSVLNTGSIAFQEGYNEQFIDFSALSKGIYILKISSGNGLQYTGTVLIE